MFTKCNVLPRDFSFLAYTHYESGLILKYFPTISDLSDLREFSEFDPNNYYYANSNPARRVTPRLVQQYSSLVKSRKFITSMCRIIDPFNTEVCNIEKIQHYLKDLEQEVADYALSKISAIFPVETITPLYYLLTEVINHLSAINRYCGAFNSQVSVAVHSILAHTIAKKLLEKSSFTPEEIKRKLLLVLFHDVGEAYLNDQATQTKDSNSIHSIAESVHLARFFTSIGVNSFTIEDLDLLYLVDRECLHHEVQYGMGDTALKVLHLSGCSRFDPSKFMYTPEELDFPYFNARPLSACQQMAKLYTNG